MRLIFGILCSLLLYSYTLEAQPYVYDIIKVSKEISSTTNAHYEPIDSIASIDQGIFVVYHVDQYITKWSNNQTKSIITFNNDSPFGLWRYFNSNGELLFTCLFSGNGCTISFFTNDTLTHSQVFKHAFKFSKAKQINYSPSGFITSIERITVTKKNGDWWLNPMSGTATTALTFNGF